MLGYKLVDSPIEANHRLCSNDGKPTDKKRVQRLVGKLIPLSHTKHDIAYFVKVVKSVYT